MEAAVTMAVEQRVPGRSMRVGTMDRIVRTSRRLASRRLRAIKEEQRNLWSITDPCQQQAREAELEVERMDLETSRQTLRALNERLKDADDIELASWDRLKRSFPTSPPEMRTDAPGKLFGLGVVFHNPLDAGSQYEIFSGVVERVLPTAFDRALTEKLDVAGLFNHDVNLLLARTSSGTMRLKKTLKGLEYEMDLGDTRVAQDVRSMVARRDLQGSSFSFDIIRERWFWEDGIEVRELQEVVLFDVGPVVFAAYPATSVAISGGAGRALALDVIQAQARVAEIEAEPNMEAAGVGVRRGRGRGYRPASRREHDGWDNKL